VSQRLPVEGLGEVGDDRWRAAHGSSSSGERRLEFRRARVGNGNGAWSRSSRARRGSNSETQLKKREVGRRSSTWSRGGGNGDGRRPAVFTRLRLGLLELVHQDWEE
jgi:hypothetical protein